MSKGFKVDLYEMVEEEAKVSLMELASGEERPPVAP